MSLLYRSLGSAWPVIQKGTLLFTKEWYTFFQNLYASVASAVNVVSQSGIPFIIPSSGTMANNGAITLTTALPGTFANCYLYLPASAIYTGSAAGWYFAQMSSTTAGTVYNSTYTSGLPAIPKTLTAFATPGTGAYTQVTTAQSMQSVSVSGTLMGANGRLRIESSWSYPNNANNKTSSISFGGSTVFSAAQTTSAFLRLKREIINRGVQGAQITAPSTFLGGAGTSTGASSYLSIDTSKSQSVTFTGQLAVATDYLIHEAYTVEVLPN